MSRIALGGPVVAVAHRGDWHASRENTLPAIAGAVRAGADLVEIDVKTTADGEVVLLHDATLARLWELDRPVRDCSYAELAMIDSGGHQIPTLDSALAMIGGTRTAIMIDLDEPDWAEPAWQAVDRAVRGDVLARDEVTWCGRTAALARIRDLDPAARIVFSWDERDGAGEMPSDAEIAQLRPEAINPHWPMITPQAISWARQRGLPLCCWTVDEEDQMRRLLDLGVQAMITNRIGLLRKVIDERTDS